VSAIQGLEAMVAFLEKIDQAGTLSVARAMLDRARLGQEANAWCCSHSSLAARRIWALLQLPTRPRRDMHASASMTAGRAERLPHQALRSSPCIGAGRPGPVCHAWRRIWPGLPAGNPGTAVGKLGMSAGMIWSDLADPGDASAA
jgi:hypothetical protein